jgi:hypothetical protein
MNKISTVKRDEDLAEFCRENNLEKEAKIFENKADEVR